MFDQEFKMIKKAIKDMKGIRDSKTGSIHWRIREIKIPGVHLAEDAS